VLIRIITGPIIIAMRPSAGVVLNHEMDWHFAGLGGRQICNVRFWRKAVSTDERMQLSHFDAACIAPDPSQPSIL
jgi:hypothetical protein